MGKTKEIVNRKWNNILTILALFLSILGNTPLLDDTYYSIFYSANVDISVDVEELRITHDFGNVRFYQWIHLQNDGYDQVTIDKIFYYVESCNNHFKKLLQARYVIDHSYLSKDSNEDPLPIMDLYLYSGGVIEDHIMSSSLGGNILRTEELKQKMYKNISNQIDSCSKCENEGVFYKNYSISDSVLYQDALKMITSNFNGFDIGEYNFLLLAIDKNGEIHFSKKHYSFEIDSTQMSVLNDITDGYKYGANGIWFGYQSNGVFVDLIECVHKEGTNQIKERAIYLLKNKGSKTSNNDKSESCGCNNHEKNTKQL